MGEGGTFLVCFICSQEGQGFENGMLSLGLLYLHPHRYLTRGPK